MSATLHWNTPAPLGLRVGAGVAVALLHVAVVGAILAANTEPQVAKPVETVEVRFVEIAPQVQVAAAPPAPTPPAPKPEPKPVPPKPVPKPVPKPPPPKPAPPPPEPAPPSETALSQPAPEPAPAPAPAPAATQPASGRPEPSDRTAAPQAPVSNEPRQVGSIDYLGAPPEPVYPRTSIRLSEEGSVLIRIRVNASGRVEKATVEKSSGFSRLDEAGLEAAARGRFKPYTENGVALVRETLIPFNFYIRRK
ncbi:energy transducer TonB [Pigmentiphaga sp.]|uniref:energy transducer TonB n=1 Tax=Pigmentiphaga sp. TaxID=1977564 RepID=UPI0025F42487|nr:energy transducer TonB [Pigmentiphaga sp.]